MKKRIALVLMLIPVVLFFISCSQPPVEYKLVVGVQGEGSVSPATGMYVKDTLVTFDIFPKAGWSFSEWSGANCFEVQKNGDKWNLFLDSDKYLTAVFEKNEDDSVYRLMVQVDGRGHIAPSSGSFRAGQTVDFEIYPETGWSFSHWTGENGSDVRRSGADRWSLLMDGNKSLVGIFVQDQAEERYTIDITIHGRGKVNESQINGFAASSYPKNATVRLVAEPDNGWQFKEWSGDVYGTNTEAYLVMTNNKRVTASFERKQCNLTVNIIGKGKVDEMLVSADYPYQSIVKLTAIPDNGWEFKEWQGDAYGSSATIYVDIDGDKYVSAVFEKKEEKRYYLNIVVKGMGRVSEKVISSYADGDYPANTILLLTAIPNHGWTFAGWQGDLVDKKDEVYLEMDSDKDITAVFEQRDESLYYLTVNVTGEGKVTKSPDRNGYEPDTLVTLKAVPNNGWFFKNWRGDASGTSTEVEIEMDSNKTVTAVFEEKEQDSYYLNIKITGDGQVTKSPDSSSYAPGTTVTLTAKPASGWDFKEWRGDASGTRTETAVRMTSDKEVTAVFEKKEARYKLNVNVTGSGTVSKNPNSSDYAEGTTVTLTASPATDWIFKEWRGDASGTNSQTQVRMDRDKDVTAIFEKKEVRYKLNVSVSGSGTVSKNPNSSDYAAGTTVTLTASPASGYVFKGWSGDASGSASQTQVRMDRDKNVTATFEKQVSRYTLTTRVAAGSGTITRSPNQNDYEAGTVVTITARASSGYCFNYWTVDNQRYTGTSLRVTMNGNRTALAYFGFGG